MNQNDDNKPSGASIACMFKAESFAAEAVDKHIPAMASALSAASAGLKAQDPVAAIRAIELYNEAIADLGACVEKAGRAMRIMAELDPEWYETIRPQLDAVTVESDARKFLKRPHAEVSRGLAELKEHVAKCSDSRCGINLLHEAVQREMARRAGDAGAN